MESGSTSNNNESRIAFKEGSWFGQFKNGSNPWMARYVYGLIFLASNLLAWAVRDYGRNAFPEMERLKNCQGGRGCLGAEGVLRRHMAFRMVVLQDRSLDCLDGNRVLSAYFYHTDIRVFLLVQLVSVISFITWLNDCCQSDKTEDKCHIHVMLLATAAYIICIVGIIMMYVWYAPEPSCLLNIFFITWTLVLIQLMTSVSLHPKVRTQTSPDCERGYLNSGTHGTLYSIHLLSFIVALLAMVIATFSTGIDSQCFQVKKEAPAEDAVPYGYGFFHFVFATGAMYFAMLLIGWNTHHIIKKWTIDVGWTSTWVRIVNEWLAVCVYCKYITRLLSMSFGRSLKDLIFVAVWMLVAPVILLRCRQTNESA
ncbi:hypothetical protein Gogos_015943 [Gossypium gossypioides]|uniref:Serine incorporator n=1 Tax=Gossypium gossypioides TaxID=34282 RepID=A0A7J9B6A4_GOSGO|nr:hypothetical protein [Gossypium gossypioides]